MKHHILPLVCFISLFLVNTRALSQQNKIKGGVLGIPGFQSGFATGNIGYERLNKNQTASWQIHYNLASGSIASDAGDTKRKWVTVEKTFYLKGKHESSFLYSFFIESGTRTKFPGFIHPSPDSIPRYTRSFELCPGIAAGLHYNFSRHFGLQVLSGPKIIFSKPHTFFYSTATGKNFTADGGNEIKTGYRFMLNLCYQF